MSMYMYQVMIWVPLDLFHRELSNEYQLMHVRGLLCEGVMIWVPLDLSH